MKNIAVSVVSDVMMQKIHKYFTFGLVGLIIVMGAFYYLKRRSYENTIVGLHNDLAQATDTIEIQKDIYMKLTVQTDDLKNMLKMAQVKDFTKDETIKKLRKLIDKQKEEIVSLNQLAAKWKKAYEAEVEANQSTDPGDDPDDPSDDRIRVDFEKDFGYIGVKGYTLTNPPIAWLRVQQNRPLVLTLAMTQAKDRSWKTYVTSSEENVGVDVQIAAINPYLFREKWYEKISVDFGMELTAGMYSYVGLSYPFGPISLSAGLWGTLDEAGPYVSINYSWSPFKK